MIPSKPPAQKTDAPSEDYDNVEEVPVPEAPFASWVNEGEVPPGEENVVRASPTGEWGWLISCNLLSLSWKGLI